MVGAPERPADSLTRYLLLQARDADDPMRDQEVGCFARALACDRGRISVFDLLSKPLVRHQLGEVDVVLLGGSGDYSVAEGGPWLDAAMASMRLLFDACVPTFASCWGFQAMARALGGEVVTDLSRAEIGSVEVVLTDAGRADPVFGPSGPRFVAQMGHQDRVVRLPSGAICLARSEQVDIQAFCFPDRPIYSTQFHPELSRDELLQRLVAYPQYVERIAGVPLEEFAATCQETPRAAALLTRFVECSLGQPRINAE